MAGKLAEIITCAKFQDKIFKGYDFTGGRISHFPIDFCMGLTTVQRFCAACDIHNHVKHICYFELLGVYVKIVVFTALHVPTSMTLNDLKRRNSLYIAFFHRIRQIFRPIISVVEDRPIMSVKYCLPVPVFYFWREL